MGGKRAREGIKFLQLAVSRYSGIKFLRMCVFVVVTVNNGPTSPSLYNPFPGVLWILLRFQSFLKKSHSLAILITGVRNLVLFHTDRDREKQSRREESRKLRFWEGNCTNLLGSQERVVTHNRSYRIKSLQRSVIKVHAKSLISKQTILWLRKECRLDGKHPPPHLSSFFSPFCYHLSHLSLKGWSTQCMHNPVCKTWTFWVRSICSVSSLFLTKKWTKEPVFQHFFKGIWLI